jgi:prevent-host-death family protein
VYVTATELKNNLGKYLTMAATEDILITRNGRNVARLSIEPEDKVKIARSLFGIIPADISLSDAREERLSRYESVD